MRVGTVPHCESGASGSGPARPRPSATAADAAGMTGLAWRIPGEVGEPGRTRVGSRVGQSPACTAWRTLLHHRHRRLRQWWRHGRPARG